MREFTSILYGAEDRVATITLNRPEFYNALTGTMAVEILEVLAKVERDESIGAVVLGATGRAFCSGQDLKNMEEEQMAGQDRGDFVRHHLRTHFNPLILALRKLPKPVVGAINGVAAGAGMSLALATDVRVAADSASFMQAFSRIGLVPDAGSTYLLTRLAGLPRALELAWTARRLPAEEALAMGLVNRVVPSDELAAEAQKFAVRLARGAAQATALTKDLMIRGSESTLEEALELEAEYQSQCIVTDDFAEGVTAFLEKREPRFGQSPSRT